MITRLDSASARKISAGQVITDLSSVVKELLENALDAGAQCVTVRLQRFGLDKIVVDDNGSGIPMPGVVNSASGLLAEGGTTPLLRSRATTKRRGAADGKASSTVSAGSQAGLEEDASLGFRGEALHSLAQVSEVVVETMHADYAPYTVRVAYISETHSVQLAVTHNRHGLGTTVSVEGLFKNLPVRLKEFAKNQRKQLLSATNLLKQYAVSHPKLRLVVSHQESGQSALVTLVSLTGSNDLQRSVTEAYGAMCLSHMSRVEWHCSFGDVEGFVSKVDAGGRMSSDRQVFSLDGRIVDLPRLAAAINDAFTQCLPNAHQRQSVAFFLRIRMRELVDYDVNLAPNKRKVLLSDEDKLAEEVRTAALGEFQAASDGIEIRRQVQHPRSQLQPPYDTRRGVDVRKEVLQPVSASAFTQYTFRRVGAEEGVSTLPLTSQSDELGASVEQLPTVSLERLGSALYALGTEEGDADSDNARPILPALSQHTSSSSDSERDREGSNSCCSDEGNEKREVPCSGVSRDEERCTGDDHSLDALALSGSLCGADTTDVNGESSSEPERPSQRQKHESCDTVEECSSLCCVPLVLLSDAGNQKRERGAQAELTFPSWERLRDDDYTQCCCLCRDSDAGHTCSASSSLPKGHFSGLLDQTGKELTAYFHKRSFKDMVVLGQFNHGFIITSLGDDLFVIDQHASDEKYNYERLMRSYTATPQPLVRSVAVPMDAEEVELAVTHAPALLRHGFAVARGEDPTKLLVSSVPVLPYDVVSASDVLELVQQLVRYGSITRQLRAVWHSMATKACRTSIMIGTALSDATMRTIVQRLAELDQPWTCPHGRPTLRHLGNKKAFRME